jgi:hypothetical protein
VKITNALHRRRTEMAGLEGFEQSVHISGKHRLYCVEGEHAAHAVVARRAGLARRAVVGNSSGAKAS